MNITKTRTGTVILSSWYHLMHSVETWIDLFWFGLVDLFVFGLIAVYFVGRSGVEFGFLIMGFILWRIVFIAQYSINLGMMWEVWGSSFTTLFVSPLKMNEFLLGHMLGGILKSLMSLVISSGLSFFLYGFWILSLSWWLAVYGLLLLVFGWIVGMIVMGLILRFGVVIQSFSWGLVFIFQALGAVFFPVKVLPPAIRAIAKAVPITYVFESARSQLSGGGMMPEYLVKAGMLSVLYAVFAYWFLKTMLRRAKRLGEFVRLET